MSEPQVRERALPARGGVPRLLVVDDEPANLLLLGELLGAEGYRVLTAGGGHEALRIAREERPDAILLDVMMPELDGYAVCRELKSDPDLSSIPVIVITSLSDRADRIEALQAGADDFFSKPIDSHEVVLRVRNAVRSKRLFDELHESYRRIQTLERLRDDLTHMIVHDMRSPLTGILGWLNLVLVKLGDDLPEYGRTRIRSALTGAGRLLEMMNTMLDVSRLETDGLPLDLAVHDLCAVAAEAIEGARALAGEVELELVPPARPVLARCDPRVLRRVLTNLLDNALKFTPPDGRVSVRIRGGEGDAGIDVSDAGPGIRSEDQDRIFEKFAQLRDGEKVERHSSGLGLTFCKLAVEAHGGTISVHSRPGRGTTFSLSLPAPVPG
jgi:signal transduction histidine kinase